MDCWFHIICNLLLLERMLEAGDVLLYICMYVPMKEQTAAISYLIVFNTFCLSNDISCFHCSCITAILAINCRMQQNINYYLLMEKIKHGCSDFGLVHLFFFFLAHHLGYEGNCKSTEVVLMYVFLETFINWPWQIIQSYCSYVITLSSSWLSVAALVHMVLSMQGCLWHAMAHFSVKWFLCIMDMGI